MSEGQTIQPTPGAVDIHTWFGLTYSNYLVLPRSVLQSMPKEWQHEFVALLEQMQERFGGLDWPATYNVSPRGSDGKFIEDPIPHYDRGRTVVDPCPSQWFESDDRHHPTLQPGSNMCACGLPAGDSLAHIIHALQPVDRPYRLCSECGARHKGDDDNTLCGRFTPVDNTRMMKP